MTKKIGPRNLYRGQEKCNLEKQQSIFHNIFQLCRIYLYQDNVREKDIISMS